LTLIAIPLTFSIANGLAFGFTAYVILAAIRRGPRSISWPMYLMTALFILRFIYMAG
jgi:AGZA family xanthine/uracil permease-like MFS transporter